MKHFVMILIFIVLLLSSACSGPSEEEITQTAEVENRIMMTETAAAVPTDTPTPAPTDTPEPSPTPQLIERINAIEDVPLYPNYSEYEFNGSILLSGPPPALDAASRLRDDPGTWDSLALIALPEETTPEDVAAYYESLGLELIPGESFQSVSYTWERYDEENNLEIVVLFRIFEQDEDEIGPSLLIQFANFTD